MMIDTVATVHRPIYGFFTPERVQRLGSIGRGILRYGLAALLLYWGGFKFFAFEAEAIQPFVAESPFLAWLYPLLGVRGAAALIGIIEIAAALLICTRRWRPDLSALGSLLAAGTFLMTLSFLFTTPGGLSPMSPFGGFLLKDVILLGAALYTAAEALAAQQARGHLPHGSEWSG